MSTTEIPTKLYNQTNVATLVANGKIIIDNPAVDGVLFLRLPDQSIRFFLGKIIGAQPEDGMIGELCYSTAMQGYQEAITDPSFAGQIINFTFPHIGNVGVNRYDIESFAGEASLAQDGINKMAKPKGACGIIVSEMPTASSNYRAEGEFSAWLALHNIAGIYGVDTREVTQIIRDYGSLSAIITKLPEVNGQEVNGQVVLDIANLNHRLAGSSDTQGIDLASEVCNEVKIYIEDDFPRDYEDYINPKDSVKNRLANKTKLATVVLIDFGCKLNIIRCLTRYYEKVIAIPPKSSIADLLSYKPSAIVISNGAGDPAATMQKPEIANLIKGIIESDIPTLGICLGHQLLAIASGYQTMKLPKGHRGVNHPVITGLGDKKVMITSQNHGFAVNISEESFIEVTHRSVFDGSIEGFRYKNKPIMTVQFHPEASPGPSDAKNIFWELQVMSQNYLKQKAN